MKEIFRINNIEILKSNYIDECIDMQNDIEILDINYTKKFKIGLLSMILT